MEDYRIWIKFFDNFCASMNIRPFISTGISSKLLDYEYFKQVKTDDFGEVAWNNGFDFCPNYLCEIAENQ